MKYAFFFVILVSWLWAHWYVWRRASSVFRLRPVPRFILAAVLGLLAVAWPVARGLQKVGENLAVRLFQGAGSLWMGFICVLLLTLLAVDIAVLLPAWIAVRRRRLASGARAVMRLWSFVIAVVSAVIISAVAISNARGPVSVTRHEIRVAGLPGSLDGYTVMFLSDVHQGGLVGVDDIDRIERAVKSVRFDVITFGGDLTDEENGGDGSVFRRMAGWGRLGSSGNAVAVSGNHDRYSGGDTVLGLMAESGIRVLRQEHFCTDEGLCVAGVDDPQMLPPGIGDDVALERALSGIPPDSFTILLSHQPIDVETAASRNVGLMLSGHTHHGQFPPAIFFTPLVYPYWAGLYSVGDMYLYVTSGAGFWGPPLRLGSRPEVAVIVLRKGIAPGR
jgi:predicted MPP superfamily phosphohydrolase